MIGGNLSTNAGGIQVLRYGNARELVLGLEVVLPDGRVWDGLRGLRKDNTGYDLKQLFIGAEGTLGVITAAVLRLYPRPRATATAFIAVPDVAAAVALLGRMRAASGETVTSFELIPRLGLDFALRHVPDIVDPLGARHDWYVLAELWAGAENAQPEAALEAVLAEGLDAGLVVDATLAASEAQAQALWRIREGLVEAQKFEGGSIKHDIAVPISGIVDFLARASAAAEALVPGIRPVAFGHIGDGNIHFNLSQPEGADTQGISRPLGRVAARGLSGGCGPERLGQRGTRYRPAQPRNQPAHQVRGRNRPHAPGQAGTGPGQCHESGPGGARIARPASRPASQALWPDYPS